MPITFSDDHTTIHHDTAEALLASLPDASVRLITVDPPYFKFKMDQEWDRQWEKSAHFLEWIGGLCGEYQRVLAPNGSLYMFASPQMAHGVEGEIRKRFAVLNHIIWMKPDGPSKRLGSGPRRLYFPQTERIVFAEHHNSDSMAKGEGGYHAALDATRGDVFAPLRLYLVGELKRAGLRVAQLEKKDMLGNFMPRHYFGRTQWTLPTEAEYRKLQQLLNQHGPRPAPAPGEHHPDDGLWRRYCGGADYEYLKADYEYLKADYEYLKADYEGLKQEYESLRRPFNVGAEDVNTDVWQFDPVWGYPGKHPCEKPQPLMEHIIRSSSRPGDLVLDSFLGSGSTADAARRLGRRFVGCDKDEHWASYAAQRIAPLVFGVDAATPERERPVPPKTARARARRAASQVEQATLL